MPKNTFFVILILGSQFWAEGFPPVKLTASRSEIIETASVILTCEGRLSSPCFLYTSSGGTVQDFSCNQTFTGTELLQMGKRSAPADVGLKCCFPEQSESCSHYSDMLSVNVQPLPAPILTVNPAVITETDTVTLTCAAPSSVSVSTCDLFILAKSRGFERNFICRQTLRGAELLQMVNMESRKLPAEVKVNCRYRAEPGHVLSQYGNPSFILIQDEAEKKTDLTTFIPSQTSTGPTSRTESNNNPTDGFTLNKDSDKTSSSSSLSDLRILKILFVALTGFGSVLGIIFLFLTFVIRQRAGVQKDTGEPGKVVPSCNLEPYMITNIADSSCDDLEVQIMQETKTDEPDDLYHTIPD